jgi:hypothetical protein
MRDRDGAELWVVAVKATIAVAPDGALSLAATQEPVLQAPVPLCTPTGAAGLRYESDMLPGKQYTDVIVHATAYAPYGRPARAVTVSAKIGRIAKTLCVVGDRVWENGIGGLRMSPAEAFDTMPLTWQRAFGGEDPRQGERDRRNPLGRGFALRQADLAGRLAPNITYPGIENVPAGLGPVAREWLPRAQLAGTYDKAWQEKRKPLPPEDFDDRFHQAAPADQQVLIGLLGGEEVELINLTSSGKWRFQLPRVALNCATRFGRQLVNRRPELHTVIIEPDAGRVIMVWLTAVPCHYTLYELTGSHITLKRQVGSSG